MKHSTWQIVTGILLFCIVALVSWQAGTLVAVYNQAAEADKTRPVVIIDVGRGGSDPGKIGTNGQLEKDINLKISGQLKVYLETSDMEVIPTRGSGQELYSSGDSHKKIADMRKRCEIINEAAPDLMVSIHQSSYHKEYVSGNQIFYYKTSEEGELLVEILQERSDCVLDEVNKRTAKVSDNYYFLFHVKEPIIIVECGFPSNGKEAKHLENEEYQGRMAWIIHMGIMKYSNTVKREHQRPVIRPGNQKNRFKNGEAAHVRVPSHCFM